MEEKEDMLNMEGIDSMKNRPTGHGGGGRLGGDVEMKNLDRDNFEVKKGSREHSEVEGKRGHGGKEEVDSFENTQTM